MEISDKAKMTEPNQHLPDASSSEKGAAVRIPPPLTYLATIVAGILIHSFILEFRIDALSNTARISAGILVCLLGFILLILSFDHFKRTGQNPKPWKSTPELILKGIYTRTRNPMYIGMGLIQAGLGVSLNNLWITVFVAVALGVVHFTAVRPEEIYLEQKFGEAYCNYKKSVRRWI